MSSLKEKPLIDIEIKVPFFSRISASIHIQIFENPVDELDRIALVDKDRARRCFTINKDRARLIGI